MNSRFLATTLQTTVSCQSASIVGHARYFSKNLRNREKILSPRMTNFQSCKSKSRANKNAKKSESNALARVSLPNWALNNVKANIESSNKRNRYSKMQDDRILDDKLSKTLSDMSDDRSRYTNREYKTLIEQCNAGDQNEATLNDIKDASNWEEIGQINQGVVHGNSGAQTQSCCVFSEPETWNVISHINKRHSYGKSLRYSDRFYRNWAIKVAQQLHILNQKEIDREYRQKNLPGNQGSR